MVSGLKIATPVIASILILGSIPLNNAFAQYDVKSEGYQLPLWLKNNAEWWSRGIVFDDVFADSVGFLVKKRIIHLPGLAETAIDYFKVSPDAKIPVWLKTNALWWSKNQITDGEFVNGLQYLVKEKIIDIPPAKNEAYLAKLLEEPIGSEKFQQPCTMKTKNNPIMGLRQGFHPKLMQTCPLGFGAGIGPQYTETSIGFGGRLAPQPTVSSDETSNVSVEQRASTKESPMLTREYVEELARTNPLVNGLIDGQLKFYIEPIPSYAGSNVEETVELVADILVTSGGFYPNMEFKRVYNANNADVQISWIKNYESHTVGEPIFKSVVEVGLGKDSCYRDWRPFDSLTIMKVLWHELGHSI